MVLRAVGREQRRLTDVLQRWSNGDRGAAETILDMFYDELREMARQQLRRERHGHTLQATALAHEAFMRLAQANNVRFQSRAHSVSLFACVMRRVPVDYARERNAPKRHGKRALVTLNKPC